MDNTSLVVLAGAIQSIIQQDPGNRGLARWAIGNQLLPAAVSLSSGNHCLICTGFFIPSAGAIETDGPPGTVILAQALANLGRRVTILTDRHGETILRAGLDAVGCPSDLLTFSRGDHIDHAEIVTNDMTHFVAVERPGVAADGCHHTMKGEVISDHVAPLDDLFLQAASRGLITIGVGDGGNELGMGNVVQAVGSFASPGQPYPCVIPSDFCICAGVSNWGAYALAALLSVLKGTNLLLKPDAFSSILEEIVRAGAVDGVTGNRASTVDNLPRTWEDEIYEELYHIAEEWDEKDLSPS